LSLCRVLLLQRKPKLGRTKPSTGPRFGHSWSELSVRLSHQLTICGREAFSRFSPRSLSAPWRRPQSRPYLRWARVHPSRVRPINGNGRPNGVFDPQLNWFAQIFNPKHTVQFIASYFVRGSEEITKNKSKNNENSVGD